MSDKEDEERIGQIMGTALNKFGMLLMGQGPWRIVVRLEEDGAMVYFPCNISKDSSGDLHTVRSTFVDLPAAEHDWVETYGTRFHPRPICTSESPPLR
jgi:hypothetical protein